MSRLKFKVGIITDKGNVRDENEDSVIVNTGTIGKKAVALIAVADGMGGLQDGAIASYTILDCLNRWWQEFLSSQTTEEIDLNRISSGLDLAIENGNQIILENSYHSHIKSGTTLSLAFITDCHIIYKHTGDCRIYLYKSNLLKLLTCDQAIEQSDKKNRVLMNAIGVDTYLDIQSGQEILHKKDKILICSDGFYNHLSDGEIICMISKRMHPQKITDLMLARIKAKIADDNISAVILSVK